MSFRQIPIGTLKISSKAKRYVNQALASNRLSYGPFSQKFEALFAKMHQSRFAVVSSSGTAALQIAIAALKEVGRWKDGDEVLVPATTFIATSNIVLYNNLRPVFVEIDPVYFGINPLEIEKRITKKTRAIIPVHLFGQPADMSAITKIARKKKLRVVEDSAETMLATHEGKSVGALGDIGCFSTYVAHLLTTGVGGINTTQDPELAVILRSLINHGRDSIYLSIDDDDKAGKKKMNLIVKKRFSFVRLGRSARLTEMECAIGLAQLEDDLRKNISARQKNATILTRLLKPLEDHLELPKTKPGNTHSFMMYPLVLKNGPKNRLVEFLESRGVETRDLMPLINQPVYRKLFKLNPKDYPVSQRLIESGFYVGCHQDLSQKDLEIIADLIRLFLKK